MKAVVTINGKESIAKFVESERNAKGRLVAKGTLRRGLKIGTEVHREFELEECLTEDLLIAEKSSPVDNPLNYNTALLTRQLVRMGSYEGPFTVGMIGTLRTKDFEQLRMAQAELEALGEFFE